MDTWTPPTPPPFKRRPPAAAHVYDQLFSHTLYSYDFDRGTWYPDIPPPEIHPCIELRHLGPPTPLDPSIMARFKEYERIQFDLLKERHLHPSDSVDAKVIEHEKKNASLLSLINLQITMEKDYEYSVAYQKAYQEASDIPKRKDYLIVNKTLPLT